MSKIHEIVNNGVRIKMALDNDNPVSIEIFSEELTFEAEYGAFSDYCTAKMIQRYGLEWKSRLDKLPEVVCESKEELKRLFGETS